MSKDAPAPEEVEFATLKSNTFNAEPLANMVDKKLTIVALEEVNRDFQGKVTTVPIVTTKDGKRYYTFSQVVKKQLDESVRPALADGKVVSVTVGQERGKVGRYLTLK